MQPQQCQQWQGGGGKASAPKPTKAQRELEENQLALTKRQLKDSKKPAAVPTVAVPPPAPPLPPPPASTSADVMNAEEDARRQAQKRRGIRSTLLATANDPNALGGQQSLLG